MIVHVRRFRGQEIRVQFQLFIQVETADVEHLGQRRAAEIDLGDGRAGIDALQAARQRGHVLFTDEVGFRQQQLVGKAHLPLGFLVFIELLHGMAGIDHRDDGVEHVVAAHFFVDKEGLRHGAGIGQARRFDDDAVERQQAGVALARQFRQAHDQVAAHGAADAAVVHLDDVLVAILHQDFIVDVFLAKLVFDHGDAHAMVFLQYAVEQGGFACAEEAGEDGGWNQCHEGCLCCNRWCRRASGRMRTIMPEFCKSLQMRADPLDMDQAGQRARLPT